MEKTVLNLYDHVLKTPLISAPHLSKLSGYNVFLKLETRQPTSSFKVRPAFMGILKNLELARAKGVLATSSGNFAQAVAYAGHKLSVRTAIVMTDDTAPIKIKKTREWGGEVIFCGLTFESRFEKVNEVQAERQGLLLHGFDSEDTITGNATIGEELLEQLPGDFAVISPASGGGLVSGIATAVKKSGHNEVYVAQPEAGGAVVKSLAAGKRVNVGKIVTIADALVASMPGERTFAIIQKFADGAVCVSEDEIRAAVSFLFRQEKEIAEPGGAVSVAALMTGKIKPKSRNVVCIISGANVDFDTL